MVDTNSSSTYIANPTIKQTNFNDEGLGVIALYACHEIEALLIMLMREMKENETADVEWMGMTSLTKRIKKLNSVVATAICETPMSNELRKELMEEVG